MRSTITRNLLVVCVASLNIGVTFAADRFPERPVRMIMPFAAGGGSDSVGRIVAQQLSAVWKQSVIVDSRTGAGGNIGTEIVAKAEPDGHTLLFNGGAMFVAPHVYKGLPFDPIKDFVPITKLGFSPAVVLVNTQVNANSIAELIALAKVPSSQFNYGSAGTGSAVHLATELFNTQARIKMEHVPYKGGALALTDLSGGRIQVLFSPLPPATALSKAGKAKLLAVTTAQRSQFAPELPTVAESGLPGYDFSYWWGIFAPAKTPSILVTQLNRDIVKVVDAPTTKKQLEGYGVTVASTSLPQFAAEVRNELRMWGEVAKSAGVKPQ